MSDLHNLSAPIEESSEEIAKKEAAVKISQKQKLKEDAKKIILDYKKKYLKKLFLALGISITFCIILVWAISSIFGNKPAADIPTETPPEITETPPENTIKYIKFDGHQYFFYVPEGYSFLNRTRSDDLNEIVFSNDAGTTAFVLQEFEAENHDEETLSSIYSYITTTVPPNENIEIKSGENTFKRRSYSECDVNETEGIEETNCPEKRTYYSTYINGLIIIFETTSSQEILEKTILPTFTKNIITPESLSTDYIYARIPNIKTQLQAKFALGTPFNVTSTNGTSQHTWKTAEDYVIVMEFDPTKKLVSSYGKYDENFTFDINDAITNKDSPVTPSDIHEFLLTNPSIEAGILRANPNAQFFVSDRLPNDNLWEITVTSPDTGLVIGEYTVTKDTKRLMQKTTVTN